jgi:hypothetical protein
MAWTETAGHKRYGACAAQKWLPYLLIVIEAIIYYSDKLPRNPLLPMISAVQSFSITSNWLSTLFQNKWWHITGITQGFRSWHHIKRPTTTSNWEAHICFVELAKQIPPKWQENLHPQQKISTHWSPFKKPVNSTQWQHSYLCDNHQTLQVNIIQVWVFILLKTVTGTTLLVPEHMDYSSYQT